MIHPFEQLWSGEFLKQELIDLFGEFDPLRWDLGAGTKETFEAHLAAGLPLDDFYRNEIGFVYQSAWNQSTNSERDKYSAQRDFALRHGLVSALDYGCGNGAGVVTLALAGLGKVVGAEINLPSLQILQRRIARFGLENARAVDLAEKSIRQTFDLVVCTEVFEHVEDPFDLARKLDKRLKPGGYAILSWSFVEMPTHLSQHFHLQNSHPDTLATEGFGKLCMVDELGYECLGYLWFNNHAWHKPEKASE